MPAGPSECGDDPSRQAARLAGGVTAWAVAGFLVAYALCFLRPVLLASAAFGPVPLLPAGDLSGGDLRLLLGHIRAWHDGAPARLGGLVYPPLSMAFFAPLLALDQATAFQLITLATVTAYLPLTLWLPAHCGGARRWTAMALVCSVTGLVSFPLLFELERGQFDLIAMSFAMAALAIFHRRPSLRWLAYLLLSVAIQLKLYPAVFVLAFTDAARGWRAHLTRAAALGLANTAALLALGSDAFRAFVAAQTRTIGEAEVSLFNQSLYSFAYGSVDRLAAWGVAPLAARPWIISMSAGALLAVCLAANLRSAYRGAGGAVSPFLVLTCTVAALVIPPVGYNYRLSVLVGPMVALFSRLESQPPMLHRRTGTTGVLVAIISAAYAMILYPPAWRPPLLHNSLPPLLVLLIGVTLLAHRFDWAAPATNGLQPNPANPGEVDDQGSVRVASSSRTRQV